MPSNLNATIMLHSPKSPISEPTRLIFCRVISCNHKINGLVLNLTMTHKFWKIMATINKRKDKDGNMRFQVIVRLKGFPTQTATFTRITDAKQWIQNTESAIREGRHFKTSEAKKHSLGEMINRYIENFNPPDYKKAQLSWWKEKLA